MKIIAWNVNGLRATLKKPFFTELLNNETPDILALQEIKCNDTIAEEQLSAFKTTHPYVYYNTSKSKAGYSGTAVLSKIPFKHIAYDLPSHANDEGRVITCTFKVKSTLIALVNVYTPNSGAGTLKRLEYRTNEWDIAFREYVLELERSHKVIVCGDLNVAHHDIDIHNPKTNKRSAGFTDEERGSFNTLLETTTLIDTFRHLQPTAIKYSWWSPMAKSRERNKGWRIDYFLMTQTLAHKLAKHASLTSDILVDTYGSDHAPIVLEWHP